MPKLGSPAQVLEVQHCDRRLLALNGGLVGQGQSGLQRIRRDFADARMSKIALLPHVPDETEALARQRLDPALRFTVVADSPPNRVDAGRQRGFRDNSSAPDRGHKIVLADDALAVGDQVDQQVEDFWLNRPQIPVATKLAPLRIKGKAFKKILQPAISLMPQQLTTGRRTKLGHPKGKPTPS